MNEDEAFLRAILANPGDAALRLVYADFLEERGDQRAEYLRLEARLAAIPVSETAGLEVRRLMVDLPELEPLPRCQPSWRQNGGCSHRRAGTCWREGPIASSPGAGPD
jgi:uncharacterized protein (TIGR02996 family)